MNLMHLSLARTGRRHVPSVATNEQRLREYQAMRAPVMGNALPWKWTRADEYQMAEMLDGRERTTDVHWSEA